MALRVRAEGAPNADDAHVLQRIADRFEEFAVSLEGTVARATARAASVADVLKLPEPV